jgi:hypothetical protein
MTDFLAGTRQPVLQRYTADMLHERLTIMGPPRSLLEQSKEVGVAAGKLLPDLSGYRTLAKASVAYARLLIQEGRPDEARPYIDAWRPLTVQIANDSFTLIDFLVAGAIARIGQTNAAALYHELGDSVAEARTLQAATALYGPVAAFKSRIRDVDANQDQLVERHAGFLAGMLLPALGETITAADLKTSRMVEYVLLDQITCGAISLLLIGIMAAALLVALRWRFIRGASGAPLLLLPSLGQTLHILGYGVVLPLFAYFAWTRLPLLSGRELSLRLVLPLAATQAVVLVAGMAGLIVTLSLRVIRARCETLQVAIPPPGRGHRLLRGLAVAGGLIVALAQSLRWLSPTESDLGLSQQIAGSCLLTLAGVAGLAAVIVLCRYLFGSARFGLYRGTVARSLIPHLALAIVLVTLLSSPYLRTEETHLVRTDPLMAPSSTTVSAGFTSIESRVVERLRTEMLNAAGRSR